MHHLEKTLRWQLERLVRPARRIALRQLLQDHNRRIADSILVAGTARSGTTWLGDLLAESQGRILFEPFHSGKIEELGGFSYFPYLRPDEEAERLQVYCRRVFSGSIRHPWIDREVTHIRPTFRVIKEIRANLFLKWLHAHFPEVPQLLIVRHPCAVVLSRLQLKWATDGDIAAFLSQPRLIEDHLAPFMEVIERAQTDAEKHAVIWCVSHLVPLHQFQPQDPNIVFYENLCLHPQQELARIAAITQRPLHSVTPAALSRPSPTTTAASAVLTGEHRIAHWQTRLSPSETRQVLDTVSAFGLDTLYGDGLLPLTAPGGTHSEVG